MKANFLIAFNHRHDKRYPVGYFYSLLLHAYMARLSVSVYHCGLWVYIVGPIDLYLGAC